MTTFQHHHLPEHSQPRGHESDGTLRIAPDIPAIEPSHEQIIDVTYREVPPATIPVEVGSVALNEVQQAAFFDDEYTPRGVGIVPPDHPAFTEWVDGRSRGIKQPHQEGSFTDGRKIFNIPTLDRDHETAAEIFSNAKAGNNLDNTQSIAIQPAMNVDREAMRAAARQFYQETTSSPDMVAEARKQQQGTVRVEAPLEDQSWRGQQHDPRSR